MFLTTVYQTLLIVLLLNFSFGPAFFALINTGITYGYKSGALLALGIVFSDFFVCILIIILVHFGATNYIQNESNQRFLGIIAGVLLIIFGAFNFRKPVSSNDNKIDVKKPSALLMITKGFLLNSFNPGIWLLWIANVAAISKTLNYSLVKMIIYFGVTLGFVLLIELAKVSAATKLKQILTYKAMRTVNIITGVLLIIFGLFFIYSYFFNQL